MSPHASARRAQPGAVIRRDLGPISTVTAAMTARQVQPQGYPGWSRRPPRPRRASQPRFLGQHVLTGRRAGVGLRRPHPAPMRPIDEPLLLHQPSDALSAGFDDSRLQLGVYSWAAIDAPPELMRLSDMLRKPLVFFRMLRRRADSLCVVARRGDLQHPTHRSNRPDGLLRVDKAKTLAALSREEDRRFFVFLAPP